MMEVLIFPLVFILSLLFSLYGTPVARNAGIKFGIVDKPDGVLKTHKEPIPYLGGLAIYLSFLVALSLVFEFSKETLGILFGGSIISTLGLIDDIGKLSPRIKIMGEFLAVYILIKSGIYIKLWFIPEYLSILLTFLWMIGIINAFNLIDVMDGLSAGIAFIVSSIFFIIAIITENYSVAMLSMAFSGACLGFLNYNSNPASIFMGDSGSLFLGFVLSSISIMLKYTKLNKFGFIAPVFVLWIPIFETVYLFFTRISKGVSPFKGSRDHISIRVKSLYNLSVRKTVRIFYGLSLLAGIAGILNILFSFYFSLFSFLILIAFSVFGWIILGKARI